MYLTLVKYKSLNTPQVCDPIALLSNLLKDTVAESRDFNDYMLDPNLVRYWVTLVFVRRTYQTKRNHEC